MEPYAPYLGQAVIIFLVSFVIKITLDTRRELSKINGRLSRVEEWRNEHVKRFDERAHEIDRRLENLEE